MKAGSTQRLRLLLILLFLGIGLVLLTVFNATKPRIVVLHSLSSESPWTAMVDQGITKALAGNRIPVAVTRLYMNLDVLSDDADHRVVATSFRRRIDALDPHVMIVVDDETSELVGRHYVGKHRPLLVYTSLMHDPGRYGYAPDTGVVGVREQVPVGAVAALLAEMHPGRALKIAAVGIADLTGTAEMQHVLSHAWGPHRLVEHLLAGDFEQWKAFVRGPAREADVLLVLSTDKVPLTRSANRMAPEADVIVWTETNSAALPIGVRSAYVRLGGGLAVSASPEDFGVKAMEMALTRLAPAAAPAAGPLVPDSFDVAARHAVLDRRGIRLPPIYVQAARSAGHLYRQDPSRPREARDREESR